MSSLKNQVSSSNFDMDVHHHDNNVHMDPNCSRAARLYRSVDGARVALTALAFAAAVAVVGLSANMLSVYRSTHLDEDFYLNLWPSDFNARPTVAMVATGVVVIVANGVSLLASKTRSLRQRVAIHTSANLTAPVISFAAALVAMIYHYAVKASVTVQSIHSWSCTFRHLPMLYQPHFGSVCRQSEAAIGLSILIVALEVVILVVAGYQVLLGRKVVDSSVSRREKGSSPALS